MTERLLISRLGWRGDGIAVTSAGALYVPYALPGETVEVEPWHPDRRHLVKVETASPERIAPICPHFGVCGGCALQHLATSRYREWKRGLVAEALAQAGLEAAVDELVDAHGEGRRRAVFHARAATRGVLEVGFSALKSHQVVAIDRCPILAPGLDRALPAARAIAESLIGAGKPLDIQVTATEIGLDVDVRGSGPLPPRLTAALASVAERHRLPRLTRHGEMVAQRAAPTIRIGGARVLLPPGAFLQATATGEAALAALVIEHCQGARSVADLFAGVGTFALRIAETARVVAADSDALALDALRRAASATSGFKRVDVETRDLYRRPFLPAELSRCDAVVFDPPREGAEAQARALAQSTVASIIAVSCNPTTFARDARILVTGGYQLTRVTPIDQFLYSPHVEVVGRFRRTREKERQSG
jgi:23S rRNA (uracil1939-C5)-methyltransferase